MTVRPSSLSKAYSSVLSVVLHLPEACACLDECLVAVRIALRRKVLAIRHGERLQQVAACKVTVAGLMLCAFVQKRGGTGAHMIFQLLHLFLLFTG